MIIYITVGNSDDKLSQLDWSCFTARIDHAVTEAAKHDGVQVHGRWYSLPTEPWQNACWCVDFAPDLFDAFHKLKAACVAAGKHFRQDSIAWSIAATQLLDTRATETGSAA